MSKWTKPRHRPRRMGEDAMASLNRGKAMRGRELARIARYGRRKREEYARHKDLADRGVEAARFVLGSCIRKEGLTLRAARRCAVSASLETGRRMFVYECPFCGMHHLTSHPDGSGGYVFSTGGAA